MTLAVDLGLKAAKRKKKTSLLQIYCCIGMLSILGRLHSVNTDMLGWWLCERQLPSGGLNGMISF